MEEYTAMPSGPISHNVELYTARLFIQGSIAGPFKRTSDLINRRDRDFFSVNGATVTPLGQASTPPQKIATPVQVGRDHIHFVATIPQQTQQPSQPQSSGQTQSLGPGREYYVHKQAVPCYALTDTFIIYGQCHLLTGGTLETLLQGHDPFIPMTKATIYLIVRPNAPWQRELVVVNKEKLEVFYSV
ncbi:MAG: hypothetical protein QOH93_2565 [Chloroflexia bacterium]|jgi:hypothetical protein|nr:hypothetical protein [Chloroflexia bacterium]